MAGKKAVLEPSEACSHCSAAQLGPRALIKRGR